MAEAEMAAVTSSLFSVPIITWWYFWPHQHIRADALEQDLRTIRDDLWDYMYRRARGFSDPAYLDTRLCFNGLIRLAKYQKVGLWYFASLTAGKWLPPQQMPAYFRNADIGAGLKQILNAAEYQMRRRIFKFLFMEGILAPVLYPISWLIRLFTGRDSIASWQNLNSIKKLQHQAFCLGRMHIPQARLMLGLSVQKIRG